MFLPRKRREWRRQLACLIDRAKLVEEIVRAGRAADGQDQTQKKANRNPLFQNGSFPFFRRNRLLKCPISYRSGIAASIKDATVFFSVQSQFGFVHFFVHRPEFLNSFEYT